MTEPVEFLNSGPGDPGAPRRPGHGTVLRVAAALAVIAALVIWAATRPDGSRRHETAAAKPSASSSTAVSPAPSILLAVHCEVGAPLANEIESAMWHFLHGIAIRNLGVYRCERGAGPSGRVLFQAVTGRYRGVNVDLEARLRTVHGVGPDVSPHLGSVHGRYPLLAQIKALSVNLEVTVNAYGHRGQQLPLDRMRRLCDYVSLNLIL
ncbi:MAG TPA: hypothetical protein VGH43_10310 [Jatrophihabitans sp.]|jgi:hypothetical protein